MMLKLLKFITDYKNTYCLKLILIKGRYAIKFTIKPHLFRHERLYLVKIHQ